LTQIKHEETILQHPKSSAATPWGAYCNIESRVKIVKPHVRRLLPAMVAVWSSSIAGADDCGKVRPWLQQGMQEVVTKAAPASTLDQPGGCASSQSIPREIVERCHWEEWNEWRKRAIESRGGLKILDMGIKKIKGSSFL
jgi:hypothetical protein